jgi:hypothetical protein
MIRYWHLGDIDVTRSMSGSVFLSDIRAWPAHVTE